MTAPKPTPCWKKIVFVGEAPNAKSDPRFPFCGPSGDKLAQLCGLSGYLELQHAVELRNVLKKWPGPGYAGEKGSHFPMPKAKRHARAMTFEGVDFVVFVGRRVADAFAPRIRSYGHPTLNYFDWSHVFSNKVGGGTCVAFTCIPHPSGVNRFYHDPVNVERVEAFMRAIMAGNPNTDRRAG